MKTKTFLYFVVFFCTVFLMSCTKDQVSEHYTFFRPVYQTKAAVRENIKAAIAQPISSPGKIVWKNNYIYLNEPDRGVHVIDISNPAAPINKYFIAIPGSIDIAVNGNYVYADCYTDLVSIDITDPNNAKLKSVLEGVFPHRYYAGFQADTNKVILNWQRVDTVVKTVLTASFTNASRFGNVLFATATSGGAQSMAGGSGSYGVNGSMARFALQNSRMYTVSYADLKVFNIINAAAPTFVNQLSLNAGNIETIFPYKNNLFIGSRSGMFVYDATNPDLPKKLSQFTHARSCDPVIADDQYAYVTLWGGSLCGGFSNQLDVIDIKNLTSPKLVKSYMLQSPKGLAKDGDLLFICDGTTGLKIFDASNASAVTEIKKIIGFEGTDVIAMNGIAVVTAKEGLYIIDYTNVSQAQVKSVIKLNSQ